jgi:hypothetical protein
MPYIKTERVGTEPIFIVFFEGKIDEQDIYTSFFSTAVYWSEDLIRSGAHVVTEASTVPGDFFGVLNTLRLTSSLEASLGDIMQHVFYYAVAGDTMSQLFANSRALPQFSGRPMPLYRTLEDAIAAARQNIASRLQAASADTTVSADAF